MIRDLPRVPGALKTLADKLGRTRVAVSMRRSELNGTIKKKSRDYAATYKKTQSKPRRSVVGLPVARPAWFGEENLHEMLTARKGI